MPVVVENLKIYFDILQKYSNKSYLTDISSKIDIKDIEINGLHTEVFINEALSYLNSEMALIKRMNVEILRRTLKRQLKSIEFMIIIYQLHGQFREQLAAIKLLRSLCKMNKDTLEINHAYASEAFWYLLHDRKLCISEKAIELCKQIVEYKSTKKTRESFLIDLVQIVCESSVPDFEKLFMNIKRLKVDYDSYFNKSTLDSFISRNQLTHFEHVLRTKAFQMGFDAGFLNLVDSGLMMRKISLKSIEYLRSKYSDLKLHSGSYDTLIYLWTFIDHLMVGLDIVSEYYTLLGIEKEAKQYLHEFFVYSVKYCVPMRTKAAVRMLMHTEYIYLRLPELAIRRTQLTHLESSKSEQLDNSYMHELRPQRRPPVDQDTAEYHYGMIDDYASRKSSKRANNGTNKAHRLYVPTDSDKEMSLEACFLKNSTFKSDLLKALELVKSYIWQVDDPKSTLETADIRLSTSDEWHRHFIEPLDEQENTLLQNDLQASLNLSTPPSSPLKSSSAELKVALKKAPMRVRGNIDPMISGPVIIKKEIDRQVGDDHNNNDNHSSDSDVDEDDTSPIESFATVYFPHKIRNIKYEDPEIPRSFLGNNSVSALIMGTTEKSTNAPSCAFANITGLSVTNQLRDLSLREISLVVVPIIESGNSSKSLIDCLEDHVTKFRNFNVPVIHRPIYQRLALHYLSVDSDKAAFYLSLAVNIGFRQLYATECVLKLLSKNEHMSRWQTTHDSIIQSMRSAPDMHACLERLMPNRWTVLQFCMIDEIPIGGIRSSLLNGVDGGCMGARNRSVLLVTKYQKCRDVHNCGGAVEPMKIETRVLHGFRKTGMQLMDRLENLKADSSSGLKITDRKAWWKKRFNIDTELKQLTDQMRSDWLTDSDLQWLMDEGTDMESEPKILITDRNISKLPMECLLIRNHNGGISSMRPARCITRMPNMVCLIGHLHQARYRHMATSAKPQQLVSRLNLEVDPLKAFFLVNPDNSLQQTEDALLPLFRRHMNWDGLTGSAVKSLDALNILSSKDMLIYCGHGSGSRYFMDRSIKSVTSATNLFLIGCQSARFIVEGRSEAFGMIMYYLTIGCPSIFGLLWDVTDREIDKFTVTMLSNWLNKSQQQLKPSSEKSETYWPSAPMPSYIFNEDTIDNVQLKTLTGKSAIVFGLPTWIDEKADVPQWKSL